MKITGADLRAEAAAHNENPYYLAYALATGCKRTDEAWARDKYAGPFTEWMRDRWNDAAKKYGVGSDWIAVTITPAQMEDELAEYVSKVTEEKP